jgi:hypothetical protein
MNTHPIIARLYMDRQRQQRLIEDARVKLQEAGCVALAFHPARREYGTDADYHAALDAYNDWLVQIKDLIGDLAETSAAIADSLSAPDAHLKGYPR